MDNAIPSNPSSRYSQFQVPGKNYWIVREEQPFLVWCLTFPGEKSAREYLDFLKFVLQTGEDEQVYRVVHSYLHQPHRKFLPEKYHEYSLERDEMSFIEFMEQAFVETGNVIFGDHLGSIPNAVGERQVFAATRLSYYDREGRLIENDIDDIGGLLREVSPYEDFLPFGQTMVEEDDRKYWDERDRACGPALYFSGRYPFPSRWEEPPENHHSNNQERACKTYSSLSFSIYTHTDIWLPQVNGRHEWIRYRLGTDAQYELSKTMPLFDNRELAERNAPRLNRFLKRIRQRLESEGGIWEYDYGEASKKYQAMCSEDGIIL